MVEGTHPIYPSVSVLVPAHNYERFVGEAIESVLSQDYPGAVECVVVDDGSTDGTAVVVAQFGNRVIYVRQPNRGQAAALNTAFRRATGDILCLLDADDTWTSDKVRRVARVFVDRPRVGLVHHRLRVSATSGEEIHGFPIPREPADGWVSRRMRKKVLPYPFWFCSAVSLRRDVAKLVFPLSERQKGHADGLVATSAALLAPVAFLDEVLGTYRVHGKNLWAIGCMQTSRKRRREDLMERARRFVVDLEDKVEHANCVLRRAGERSGLSPWMNWSYLKYQAILRGKAPAHYLLRAWLAAWTCPRLSVTDRLDVSWTLARRALRTSVLGVR